MTKAIGVRLPESIIRKVDELSKKEAEDRSTIIRKLLTAGYKEFIIKTAAQAYMEGRVTLSEAARQAETTLWEMEQYLVRTGFSSGYSIEDLEAESNLLKSGK